MPRVCIPHVLISSATIFGIAVLYCDLNRTVYERVANLINIMWCETEEEKETRWKKEIEERRREEEAVGKTD